MYLLVLNDGVINHGWSFLYWFSTLTISCLLTRGRQRHAQVVSNMFHVFWQTTLVSLNRRQYVDNITCHSTWLIRSPITSQLFPSVIPFFLRIAKPYFLLHVRLRINFSLSEVPMKSVRNNCGVHICITIYLNHRFQFSDWASEFGLS